MKFIGALPELVVLKLRCLAFQGPKWTLNKGEFDRLVYLLLEDHDIVNWNIEDEDAYFPRLRKIFIKDCYKLKEIPSEERLGPYSRVELFDCNPSLEASARQKGHEPHVHYSWIKSTRMRKDDEE